MSMVRVYLEISMRPSDSTAYLVTKGIVMLNVAWAAVIRLVRVSLEISLRRSDSTAYPVTKGTNLLVIVFVISIVCD
jgi:hypothetical protein